MTTLAVVVTTYSEGQVPDQLLGAVQGHSIVIEALADPAHLRFGDSAGINHGINLAGEDAADGASITTA